MLKQLCFIFLSVTLVVAGARAEILEQILVKVNGEIFTKTELEQRQVAALRQKGQQFDLKTDPDNQQLRKALDEITPQIMVDAVDEMLIVQRGRELGYKLSEEQFKNVVDNIKKENKIETEEQFQNALKAENMTMTDLRRSLERSMIVQRVQQNEVIGKIGVGEDEARAYYESHKSEFTKLPTVTLREILVAIPGDARGINVAAEETAKQKAEQLRMRVTSGGESFEKVAGEASDAPSKANGGLIGPFSPADMSPQLKALVDKMKPGDITPPIRTPRGYQIFKLDTLKAQALQPFNKVRDLIADKVAGARTQTEMRKFLDRLRAQAIIEWKNDELKKAYEKQLAAADMTGLNP